LRTRLKSRRGFTLIEALVAFAILALVMGRLLASAGGAAHNESRADFYLRAARLGRAQLEALGISEPIRVGETDGRYDDGLLWTLAVEPYREMKNPAGGVAAVSYLAHLTIRRPTPVAVQRETLKLTTLKFIPVKENQP
jgi:prepilin-type N-terminal cleavage/methylation domain-containing protein